MTYNVVYMLVTMKEYQAKIIQKILKIPKHRYDYMLMKIRIEPDIERATGRGKTNLFSFAKLLEFAIANAAMNIGMSPEMLRMSLQRIRYYDQEEGWHLFDPEVEIKSLSYHVGWDQGAGFSFFSGEVSERRQHPSLLAFSEENDNEIEAKQTDFERMFTYLSADTVAHTMAYSTLNLSRIKMQVIAMD
jgi:hypothetical protein